MALEVQVGRLSGTIKNLVAALPYDRWGQQLLSQLMVQQEHGMPCSC